jgi:hypothetical protein
MATATKREKGATIRNRIVGFKQLSPSDIIPSKKNWREHGSRQKQIMKGLLEQVGIAGVMLVRPAKGKPGKYDLIDGEMRQGLLANEKAVPAAITDLTDKELDLVLATHDKIGEYAGHNEDAFSQLMQGLKSGYADLVKQFDVKDLVKLTARKGAPEYRIVPSYDESYDAVIIFCKTGQESANLQTFLGMEKQKDRNGRQGIGRVIACEDFMKRIRKVRS